MLSVLGNIGSAEAIEPVDSAYMISIRYDDVSKLYAAVMDPGDIIGQGNTRAEAMRDLGQILDEWAEEFIEG